MDDHGQHSTPDRAEEGAAVEAKTVVDGEEHPVDPRSVKIARRIGLPITLLISIAPLLVFTISWAVGSMPTKLYLQLIGVFSLLLSPLVLLAYRWPAARHKRLRYLVEEGGLRIRRGVFWRKVIWIPISRVQHTDVSQGPLQRRFELATLTVHTAGTAGASISLAGLEHGIATRLSDHLRPDRATDAS